MAGISPLKYLGENENSVTGAAVFSVPLNLHTSCEKISRPDNFIYSSRFLKSLKKKVISKSMLMKGIDINGIERITTLKDFDDRYTAPLHGFRDAMHYYESCSSLYFLEDIRVPTLIVNAKNDPFLSEDCYPGNINNPSINLSLPGMEVTSVLRRSIKMEYIGRNCVHRSSSREYHNV